MKMSGGLKDNGVVIGNITDKYGSQNPIVRYIMKGFHNAFDKLFSKVTPGTIHEVGCGEGYWVIEWNLQGINARGSDFSNKIIELARMNAASKNLSPDIFEVHSIYDLEPEKDSADLIVCSEMLEHLEHPEEALRILQRVASDYLIFSVPHEPVWRVLNMMRGKYLGSFGNTPGHLQHWSIKSFIKLVERYFDVVDVRTPAPWIMLLCRVRR